MHVCCNGPCFLFSQYVNITYININKYENDTHKIQITHNIPPRLKYNWQHLNMTILEASASKL
jgi:hypothetical protein